MTATSDVEKNDTRRLTHPQWCAQQSTSSCLRDDEHTGPLTEWGVGLDSRVTLLLARMDELDGDIQDRGDATIRLGIEEEGTCRSAAAYLPVEDAEVLLLLLRRHVDQLKRPQFEEPTWPVDS